MMRGPIILVALLALPGAAARAGDNLKSWFDVGGDAMPRRTDPLLAGSLGAGCTLPNLLRLTVGGWQTPTPTSDPYAGVYTDPDHADLLRFDLELKGVVNPPGSASLSGYNPFAFGPSPLFGAIEFDIDADRDTGGELGGPARSRYLANVTRFGRVPYGSIGARTPKFGWEIDSSFFTPPQFERSGADFVLAFCGCYPATIISEAGNSNGVFEAGESWVIRGGFFQRAGGYQGICSSFGGAGGGQVGSYIPEVNLRWIHSPDSDTTIITLIFPITQAGAAQLAGQPVEPINLSAGDQASMVEALTDLTQSAEFALPNTPEWYLAHRWIGKDPTDRRYVEPDRWSVNALVGTAYAAPVDGAVFVWTDTGFDDLSRDLDGDGMATTLDKLVVYDAIDRYDGTDRDADGQSGENGGVRLINPGLNFALADVDGDGSINRFDVAFLCPGDFNRDGTINILDYMSFFNAFNAGDARADLNLNGNLETGDFVTFLNAIAAGC